jgi:hypothetical protein
VKKGSKKLQDIDPVILKSVKYLIPHNPSRRELQGEEFNEIKLILMLLEPYEQGMSFHCWDSKYRYNGKIYVMTGEFSDSSSEWITIEEMDDPENHDK